MPKFDSKSFNAQAFGKYVERVPNVKRNALAKSGAIGANANARESLKNQTGSVIFKIDSSLVNKIRDKSSRSLTGLYLNCLLA